jgi:outer membrane usher protein
LLQSHLADCKTLAFGSELYDEEGHAIGVVGQAGRIMVRVPSETGRLNVQWQDQDVIRTCSLPYQLEPRGKQTRKTGTIEQIEATCTSSGATTALVGRTP